MAGLLPSVYSQLLISQSQSLSETADISKHLVISPLAEISDSIELLENSLRVERV